MSAATASFRRAVRQVKSWIDSRVVVLLYHRIGDRAPGSGCDPHAICVSPNSFDQQMEIVRRVGQVMRLSELADGVENHRLPKRGIVVTFDDGYADNLHAAKPILEKHDISATVFVTSGDIGRKREFWWDELSQLLLEAGTLPSLLQLQNNGRELQWDLSTCAAWSDADAARYGNWDFESNHTPTARHRAYRDIYRLFWDLEDAPRRAILDGLFSQGGRTPAVRDTHRALNDDEVVRLAEGPSIEIGAHTVTHPNLSAQSVQVQRDEILKSKRQLESVIGRAVESFAYPFGLHTQQTVELVREAGFSRACACMGHAVRKSSEIFRLTRADLGEGTHEVFERKLRQAFSY